ncbi:hypothetical protein CRYUN_Cryun17cG0046900 [Craigia yunnanensis]
MRIFSGYLDLGPARRLYTNDAIIPIITTPNSSSYVNLIANLNKKRKVLPPRRSHSTPISFH